MGPKPIRFQVCDTSLGHYVLRDVESVFLSFFFFFFPVFIPSFELESGGPCGKESACQHRRCKVIWVRFLRWEDPLEKEVPPQYSCLENPMDRGGWRATDHRVPKSQTRLSNFTFTFQALEKEMTTPSSVLAWRIPGTGEPGGLLSMGSHRVRHEAT